MAQLPPNVLLQEYQTPSISDFVPAKFVQTYKQLNDLAFAIFEKSEREWSVHFHFEDDCSAGKALPLLWDAGGYFDERYLTAGKLAVFVHFEKIGGGGEEEDGGVGAGLQQGNGDPGSNDHAMQPGLQTSLPTTMDATTIQDTVLEQPTTPYMAPEQPTTQAAPSTESKQSRKRQRAHTVSSSNRRKQSSFRPNLPTMTNATTTPDTAREQPTTQSAPFARGTRSRKRHRVDSVSTDEEEGSDQEEDFHQEEIPDEEEGYDEEETSVIRRSNRQAGSSLNHRPARAGEMVSALPSSITPNQHASDFDACLTSNAPEGEYGHKDNWADIGHDYKKKVAHARLIHDIYGTVAPYACDRCRKEGLECRVYHPEVTAMSKMTGSSCGECRFKSVPCVINGQYQKKQQPSHVGTASDDTNVQTERPLHYCPIAGCQGAIKGFQYPSELKRHMEKKHKPNGPTQSPMNLPLRTLFPCPVPGCTSKAARGFTRQDNLRAHIRTMHQTHTSQVDGTEEIFDDEEEDATPESASSVYACPVPGCSSRYDVGFSSSDSLRYHIQTKHADSRYAKAHESGGGAPVSEPTGGVETAIQKSDKKALRCPVPGCSCAGTFSKEANLQKHLQWKHSEYLPPPPSRLEDSQMVYIVGNMKESTYDCPVSGCSRAYTERPNFERHMMRKHLDCDIVYEDVAYEFHPTLHFGPPQISAGILTCPVDGCSTPTGLFTNVDTFHRHIREHHPNTGHARVLTAIYENTALRLPPPSFTPAQYKADQGTFRVVNAAPGEFGHRPPQRWSKITDYVRQRISQGRLLHKYGILAPEACSNCKKKGVPCLILHPGLKVPSLPGKMDEYCDQCKIKSYTCDIQPGMFDKLLERPGSTLAAADGEFVGADLGHDGPLYEDRDENEHQASKNRVEFETFMDGSTDIKKENEDEDYEDYEDDDSDDDYIIQVVDLESTPGSSRGEDEDIRYDGSNHTTAPDFQQATNYMAQNYPGAKDDYIKKRIEELNQTMNVLRRERLYVD